MDRCGTRCGRWIAIGVAVGFAAAAAILLGQITSGEATLRAFRWPLPASGVAQLASFAVLTLVGAFVHPAALIAVASSAFAFMVAGYGSESIWAPVIVLAIVALVVAYWRLGGGIRALSVLRLVVLGLSVVATIAGVVALAAPTKNLLWDQVRRPDGSIATRTFVSSGTCGTATVKDRSEVASGCDEIIPARRARFVIGYSAAAVVLGIGAIAGAPKKRKVDEMGFAIT